MKQVEPIHTFDQIKTEAEGVGNIWLRFKYLTVRESYRFAPRQFNMLYLPGYGEATTKHKKERHRD